MNQMRAGPLDADADHPELQSSVAKAYPGIRRGRAHEALGLPIVRVDVMEELDKFTMLTRDVAPYLVDRYSERKESARAH